MENLYSVITTIQAPTESVHLLNQRLNQNEGSLIVIGDKAGPTSYPLKGIHFLDIESQKSLPFQIERDLPYGHYSRKNLGYLESISQGANCIFESDDDNQPSENWHRHRKDISATLIETKGWVNIYELFTEQKIWPRGFPIELLQKDTAELRPKSNETEISAPIQQILADGSPDVDAIWRMLYDHPIQFEGNAVFAIGRNTWCPFNSQATWWWQEAFHLLYLPSYCSFRMTDIWRSFIAQRCLWEMNEYLAFCPSEILQKRNPHNTLNDFELEIDGYLKNVELCQILESLELSPAKDAKLDNLLACYNALHKKGFFPDKEIELVESWCNDLIKLNWC